MRWEGKNHQGQSRLKLTMLRPIRGDHEVRNDGEDSMEVMGWADMQWMGVDKGFGGEHAPGGKS